jgi:hypothetical protein
MYAKINWIYHKQNIESPPFVNRDLGGFRKFCPKRNIKQISPNPPLRKGGNKKQLQREYFTGLLVIFLCLGGCQTASPLKSNTESLEDAEKNLQSIAGALNMKALSDEEYNNLKKQVRNDKQARSAIEAITDSMSRNKTQVKYCPLTGNRYAANLKICPEHQVELKEVEN